MKKTHRFMVTMGLVAVGLAACAEGSDVDAESSGGEEGVSASGSGAVGAGGGDASGGTGVGTGSGAASGSASAGAGGGASSSSASAGAGGGGSLCSALSCPNGCCLNDLCMAGTSQSACGNNGVACQDCAGMNHTCAGKVCINQPQCNQASCQGCCLNAMCEIGFSDQACGKQGQACIDCSAQGKACLDGFCVQ